jgi:hypothetical protein
MILYGFLERASGYLRHVPAVVEGITEYVPLVFCTRGEAEKNLDALTHKDAKTLTIVEFKEVPP